MNELTTRERAIIGECLLAAAAGPFFPEYSFRALIGCDRARISELALEWPTIVSPSPDVQTAVNNVLLNLWGYPHKKEAAWGTYISTTPDEVLAILEKWRA